MSATVSGQQGQGEQQGQQGQRGGLRRFVPTPADYAGLSRSWKRDVVAGLTVGVVALPLALAFGITTGLGAAAGIMTAIVAGVVAAIFGGSNLQVSGPTGAMTVVLVPIVARFGADAVLVVAVLAGVLVIAAAIARLGRYLAFIPWPVIEGFTVGIAIIIFLQQVPSAIGVGKPEGENTAVVAIKALGTIDGSRTAAALGLVVLVGLTMVLLPKLHRAIPASLVAVIVATIAAEIGGLDVGRIGAVPSTLPLPHLPAFDLGQLRELLPAAFAVAALASIESLLSAKVADGMADVEPTDPDRELFGQGLANLASPLFGGMPATGAIARTAVNVRAGARTRVAAVVHSIVLVLVVFFASGLVGRIPLAALAGVLMVTAVRMVERHNVRAVVRATRSDAVVFVVTCLATVAFDLIFAVEVGVVAAAFLALRSVARTASHESQVVSALDEIDADAEHGLLHDHIVAYRLDGALFFGAAQRFLTELTSISDVKVVILRMSQVQVLDATGAQALGEIVDQLEHRGITVLLKGLRAEHLRVLRAVGALDRLAHENHVFDDLDAAVAHARLHVLRRAHDPLAAA
jgi:SulP family sulfate permease